MWSRHSPTSITNRCFQNSNPTPKLHGSRLHNTRDEAETVLDVYVVVPHSVFELNALNTSMSTFDSRPAPKLKSLEATQVHDLPDRTTIRADGAIGMVMLPSWAGRPAGRIGDPEDVGPLPMSSREPLVKRWIR